MKKDYVILLVIIIFIGLGLVFVFFEKQDSNVIEVYYQDELIDTLTIDDEGVYEYTGSYGIFHLEIENNRYRAHEVDCPNHDCEKVGWVSMGSISEIVCVPNEIYIIQSNAQGY